GGAGQDYISDASSDPGVSLSGGADGDTIVGGFGAGDVLNGGAGDDVISSNGPSDSITGGTGHHTIVLNHLPAPAMPRLTGGGDGNDVLAISGSTGGDTVHVFKPSAADVEIDSAGGSVKAMGIHELDLNLDGGADTVTIDNLQSSSVVLAHIDLGSSDHRADS